MIKTAVTFIIITFSIGVLSQEVPFRDENTYKLELGMEYKKVPVSSTITIKPGQTSPIMNEGSDFYLVLKLNLLKLQPDDARIKITNNFNDILISKKLKKPDLFVFDIGRSTEIKNGKVANKYKIEFIDSDKTTRSIIILEFTENGIFNVNNVQFGQI